MSSVYTPFEAMRFSKNSLLYLPNLFVYVPTYQFFIKLNLSYLNTALSIFDSTKSVMVITYRQYSGDSYNHYSGIHNFLFSGPGNFS